MRSNAWKAEVLIWQPSHTISEHVLEDFIKVFVRLLRIYPKAIPADICAGLSIIALFVINSKDWAQPKESSIGK